MLIKIYQNSQNCGITSVYLTILSKVPFLKENKIEINYSFYITNQIMKPVQQVFALVLENLADFKKRKGHTLRKWKSELEELKRSVPDKTKYKQKEDALRNKEVKALLFEKYLQQTMRDGTRSITSFFS